VRWHVNSARQAARAHKRRVLSEAAHDGEDPLLWLANRVAAPSGANPALVVELRDELRERAELARQPPYADRLDRRRSYSDEQITRALALVAVGKTIKQAAFAVGVPRDRVLRWVNRSGQARPGARRRFTPEEVQTAVGLVKDGASLRQAAAAVGASKIAVLKWVRTAA